MCQGYLPLLSAHLDGQLRGAKQTETLAHLESCEDCQKALTDMEEAKRRYRALVPPVVAIVALRENVDAALAANGYWDTPAGGHTLRAGGHAIRTGLGRRSILVATIAALSILGGLVIGVGGGGGAQSRAIAQPVEVGSPAGEASAVSNEETGTSPSSDSAAQESQSSPAETTDGETGQQPASGDGDPSAVSDAGGGGNNQPDANGGGNGESSEHEPNDSQGGSTEQAVASGGASGGGGAPESDGSQGGGGGSQGGEDSRADGESQEGPGLAGRRQFAGRRRLPGGRRQPRRRRFPGGRRLTGRREAPGGRHLAGGGRLAR